MRKAKITVETLMIPTYPEGPREEMPMFVENRVHQRSSGRVYPQKVVVQVDRSHREDRSYTVVHMENDYLDVLILPEIGGRIFAAQDKTTGYDFFYRQHVIKPALIGALGSWISGGVEFNWPYHHRPSGFMPCDYSIEECADGSVICWLSEHEPVDRMKGMVGVVLRSDCAYLETRMKLCNRTPERHSFLWWENAAVPVNEAYQIFFPHDVTYVNFHYLDSRISYPIAGDNVYNGIDMTAPRDISLHKNTRDATSYFACASKYDFFGGYDHGKGCGVVHVADHHVSPGKKMFTWAYNQLSKSWENALTDTDGQYAELMAGSYTDNQPNFSWLEPYETKEFSQFWYPIAEIGTPDFANLDCALHLEAEALRMQATAPLGRCEVIASANGVEFFRSEAELEPGAPVNLPWARPEGRLHVRVRTAQGRIAADYAEEAPDELKMPPVKKGMPLASEVLSADELYLAGVHVDQYRDPAVMPDAYWLEALRRNPRHAPSLLGMARYSYHMYRFDEALAYCERAIEVLTQFNARLEDGEAYYLHGLILEALGETDAAYDAYNRAAWCGSTVDRAMTRVACIDLLRGDPDQAERHARQAMRHNALNPILPAVRMLARPEQAAEIAAEALAEDPLNLLVRYLSGAEDFYGALESEPAQSVLDLCFDLLSMGQPARCVELLEGLVDQRPGEDKAMVRYTLACLRMRLGQDASADLRAAEDAPLGGCYPFRREEIGVLRFAVAQGSVRAKLLLGCLLYDKRHYQEGAALFEEYLRAMPEDPTGLRCLAVACFSHLNRKDEALKLMCRALEHSDSPQLLFETVALMDKLGVAPQEKIRLLTARSLGMDNLFTELAKAYNQNRQPERALEVLRGHSFVPCEGGEHAIADQYMFAWYQLGMQSLAEDKPAEALERFESALTLPQNLGAGIWNRCKYVPYRYRIAECMEALGRTAEAQEIYREILGIRIEFFSEMHLKELPFYQALSARRLGLMQRAQNLMTDARRRWSAELNRRDNGYFATTPFFISFMDDAAMLRRAQYLYLTALVKLYDGQMECAQAMLRESYALNNENLFCGFYAREARL